MPSHLFRLASILTLLALLGSPLFAQNKLSPTAAKDHVGETTTVCGNVASTHYAASTKGQPTFLNLDKAYPNQLFAIVIWGSDRGKFGSPEI